MRSLIEEIRRGKTPTFQALFEALERAFPLLNELENTNQEPEWHAEGNVLIHTRMVYDDVASQGPSYLTSFAPAERVGLLLGAVLHDIGKPLTTREVTRLGKPRLASPGHEEAGHSHVATRISELPLHAEEQKCILGVIAHHGEPKHYISKNKPEEVFRQLARAIAPRVIHRFCEADLRGRICSDHDRQMKLLVLFQERCETLHLWNKPERGI